MAFVPLMSGDHDPIIPFNGSVVGLNMQHLLYGEPASTGRPYSVVWCGRPSLARSRCMETGNKPTKGISSPFSKCDPCHWNSFGEGASCCKNKRDNLNQIWCESVSFSGFRQDEVEMNVEGNKVTLHASHNQECHGDGDRPQGTDKWEATRHVAVPEGVDPASIQRVWGRNGDLWLVGAKKDDAPNNEGSLPRPDQTTQNRVNDCMDENTATSDGKDGAVSDYQEAHSADCTETATGCVCSEADRELTIQKPFEWRVNVKNYNPDNVKVKVSGDRVTVTARQEDVRGDAVYVKELRRSFTIPPTVESAQLISRLTEDGTLTISGPRSGLERNGETMKRSPSECQSPKEQQNDSENAVKPVDAEPGSEEMQQKETHDQE